MAEKAWCSHSRAIAFLLYVGLASFPKQCPDGHSGKDWRWSFNEEKGWAYMHCFCRKPDVVGDNADGQAVRKRGGLCNKKIGWRGPRCKKGESPPSGSVPCPLARACCFVDPVTFLKALYWFCQRVTFGQAVHSTGLSEKVLRSIFAQVRQGLWKHMCDQSRNEKLGGPREHYAVCIDETFFTTRKKVRGVGVFGRRRSSHTRIVMAGVELDLRTRTETGRCFAVLIPDRSRRTFERVIRKWVHPGSRIWTDKHRSYSFLGARTSGYQWAAVNHSQGEFARDEDGVNVSTNAVEGFFGRLKKSLRALGITNINQRQYAPYMAEFVWRARYLHKNSQWRDGAIWSLARILSQMYAPPDWASGMMNLPPDVLAEFQEWQELTAGIVPEPVAIPLPGPYVPAPAVEPAARGFAALRQVPVGGQVIDLDSDSDVEVAQAAPAAAPPAVAVSPAIALPAAVPMLLSTTLTRAMSRRTPASSSSSSLTSRLASSGDAVHRFLRGERGFSAAAVPVVQALPASPASTHALFGTDSETEPAGRGSSSTAYPLLPVAPQRQPGHCPGGHRLALRRITRTVVKCWGPAWDNATTCDRCSSEIELGARSHRCNICDFDLCADCARAAPKSRRLG